MFSLMANCFEWVKRRKEPKRGITLVIIGLDDAGKTTMVAGLQGEPPDGITPTIGFANAEFSMDSFKVTVYDLGGGVRIRDVWRNYYAEVFGVVFVIDSCNTERLEESKDVLKQVAEHAKITGKPFLVFANKQDKGGAIAANEISEILDLDELSSKNEFQFKVVGCSAKKGYGRNLDKNINIGFRWLLSSISAEFNKISARVEHDVTIKKEQDEIERKARAERIRKIREERDRLEREAGRDPDKEDSDDEVMMANPFQPIGKHLDNVKAKEKKKKSEKEKKGKIELEPAKPVEKKRTDENIQDDVVKKKKKKKKKKRIAKTTENCENQSEFHNDDSVTHLEYQGNVIEKTHETESDDKPIVVKKKKKKVKVIYDDAIENTRDDANVNSFEDKIANNFNIDNNDDMRNDEHLNSAVDQTVQRKKKQKKKKKAFIALEENSVSREDGEIERYDPESNQIVETVVHETAETEVVVKKPKTKKRKKKKNNKTAPLNHVMTTEGNDSEILPPPVWTSPRTWTSLPPIGGNTTDVHSGGLPPLNNQRLVIGDSSSSSNPKLSVSPSWTRPNSEDHDLVT